MKILVCLSNAPTTTSKINSLTETQKFDTDGVPNLLLIPNDGILAYPCDVVLKMKNKVLPAVGQTVGEG